MSVRVGSVVVEQIEAVGGMGHLADPPVRQKLLQDLSRGYLSEGHQKRPIAKIQHIHTLLKIAIKPDNLSRQWGREKQRDSNMNYNQQENEEWNLEQRLRFHG